MRIRRLTPEDEEIYKEVVRIINCQLRRYYGKSLDELDERQSETIIKTFVAMKDELVVGGAIYGVDFSNNQLIARYLAVHPEFARNGIGRTLLSRVEDFAKEHGFSGVAVDAKKSKTPERCPVTWFKTQGYSQDSQVGDQVYLSKRLSP